MGFMKRWVMAVPIALVAGVFLPAYVEAAIIDCYGTGVCNGTDGDDVITGTGGKNQIYAKPGSDTVMANDESDELYLGAAYDTGGGGNGGDYIFGHENGNFGPDELDGQAWGDWLYDQTNSGYLEVDEACGGYGDDHIYLNDGDIDDDYNLGDGQDSAVYDQGEGPNNPDLGCFAR